MKEASIFIMIFSICILLVGIYMYRGHKIDSITWRAAYKNLTKDEWKNIGKWTIIVSLFIFLIGIILYL